MVLLCNVRTITPRLRGMLAGLKRYLWYMYHSPISTRHFGEWFGPGKIDRISFDGIP